MISGEVAPSPRPLRVAIINPKFQPSYWGYDYALPLQAGDKRCWVVTGALPALAALVPAHCSVQLFDENVEALDFEALKEFDVIGVTGMIVQGERMREILVQLKRIPAVIVVGGPYVSVAPELFENLCDVRFIGEADETWPQFLQALSEGKETEAIYRQADKTDMATVPTPRYDLIKADHYLMASLQFSRGCPFTCEFCDIITIFGRRPRLKTVSQMIREFDEIHRAGFRFCFLVDDNLIGNKREAKKLLAALGEWQEANGYPIRLFVEASLNLAEDAELLDLMVNANVREVFIGIESPRTESLVETKKLQNVRGESLFDRIQTIRDAGIVVNAGFIVGFDNDDEGIFEDQFRFIQEAGIAQAIVAILAPIPTTPLYDRLKAAGRLDHSQPEVQFIPAGMSREALKSGYDALMIRLYQPDAFFERIFTGYSQSPSFRASRRRMERRAFRDRRRPGIISGLAGAVRQGTALWSAMRGSPARYALVRSYVRSWRTLNLPLGKERIPLPTFVGLCVQHWHMFNIAQSRHKARFGNVQQSFTPELEAAA